MRFKFNGEWVELSGASCKLEQQGALQSFLTRSRYDVDGLYMSIEGQGVTAAELTIEQSPEVEQVLSRFA